MNKGIADADIAAFRLPHKKSHKGQNGKLLVIGGSSLFHSASLWALETASRIVDLVHYSSTRENNELLFRIKSEFRNGIVVSRKDIESYIKEDDCILIGPGMMRTDDMSNRHFNTQITSLAEMDDIADDGVQTSLITNYLLHKYPHKQWVIDAGALQMMDITLIPKQAILTPHKKEFEHLWNLHQQNQNKVINIHTHNSQKKTNQSLFTDTDRIKEFSKTYSCICLLKGVEDHVSNGINGEYRIIKGGNAGMTKGGTGDVLAGLIAAFACTNDPFVSAYTGSYINKKAGDELWKSVGPFFNASDLSAVIPQIMKKTFISY